MNLDSRIIEGKKPLDCFDTEEAKHFIGKECYFSDDARDFMDLDKADGDSLFYIAELQNIWTSEEYCFADNSNDYRFILPCEWVRKKEPELKWRPFSINEWRHDYMIGSDAIKFRIKNSNTSRLYMYCGYISDHDDDSPGKGVINLGGELFVLQNLFDQFELYKNGKWQPFGVYS